MRILIIEDEPRAANRLARMIKQQLPSAKVLAQLPSIKASVSWLETNPEPDLIFLDVRLEDGESFEILAAHPVQAPIIFCTAYSEYALDAFETNSIDYLLKPVSEAKLARALMKFERYTGFKMASADWAYLSETAKPTQYKQRFMVPSGRKLVMVETDTIVLLEAYLKGTKMIDEDGREWVMDEPVSAVEVALNPRQFYRVSRQAVVRLSSVEGLERGTSGISVRLKGVTASQTVSRSRVQRLKELLKTQA